MTDFTPQKSWAGLNELDDAALVVRLVAGDDNALAVLFDRYHRLVFSIAVRILHDEAEAEDLVQTVFLNVFEAAAKFDPARGTLKVWLLQYAYHRSLNRRRSLAAQGVYRWDALESAEEPSQAPTAEQVRLCQEVLAHLKPLQRAVMELVYFEGWTAQEIAALQNRPVAHVRHDLYRGIARLRKTLGRTREQESGEKKVKDETKNEKGAAPVADPRPF